MKDKLYMASAYHNTEPACYAGKPGSSLEVKQGEIDRELGVMSLNVEQARKEVLDLRDRIQSILRQEPEKECKVCGPPARSTTLATRLAEYNDTIRFITDILIKTKDQVEL